MNYNSWKLYELKQELRNRGAVTKGKKAELIERLIDYDRNNNFQNIIHDQADEPKMIVPPAEFYKDIHGGINLPIHLSIHSIEVYLNSFDQQITQKSEHLFQSKFLQFIKFCAISEGVYIKSACMAQMKKIIYYIDIFITLSNTIEKCQCECAAGQGPDAHCKHITAVLLGLEYFCRKKVIIVEDGCTQKLQSFHQPTKKFNRSPLKVTQLPFTRINTKTPNYGDPRPEHVKNDPKYLDFFRNHCINFSNHNMPIMQLFEPANPYGIENDHEYAKFRTVDRLFEAMGLLNISSLKIEEIENKTRGQSKNKVWFLERSFRISSTSFKDVCCMTHHRDPKRLVMSILNKDTFTSKAVRHGLIYEEEARKKYEYMKKKMVLECGLFVDENHPYLCATPDGLVDTDTVIEIKCPYTSRNKYIGPDTVPYLEIINGELVLKKTHKYYFQIMGQLLTTKRTYCDLVIYTFCDLKIIRLMKDEEFIHIMLLKLIAFYDAHFYNALKLKYYYKNYNFC